jgi:predicted ATPase/DNA-binding CsgD family transcriptional regulator
MTEAAQHQARGARPTQLTAARQLPPHNLPASLTSFIGRGRELTRVGRAADSGRLVTLVGPGGVGKSRLALEAARLRLPHHSDGIWLVDLAPLADPLLIPRAIASVLGIIEGPRRSLEAALERVLRERDLLLILDNCEHLIEACAGLVERLMQTCPRLHVVATSREPLAIGGEQLLEVSPLAVPAEGERDARRLRTNEAARLFAERARAVRPDFALTEEVGEAVALICRRLDGIALALELAAARLRTMSAAEIAQALDDRFRLLASGRRTAQPRQRTLWGMVDWSWELLSAPQRALWRRLAVFAGGWTREAAEQVCAADDLLAGEVASVLSALVDRSLVLMDDWRGSVRYRLLDTMRAHAWERLREAGEDAAVRRRHQDWCLRLLESSDVHARNDFLGWLRQMDAELDNVRAALDWCRVEPSTTERALRASPGIWMYWDTRGHADESCQQFEELLALLPAGPPTAGQVIGQSVYCHALGTRGDFARAVPLFKDTLALESEVNDRAASFWCGAVEVQYLSFICDPTAPAVGRARLAEQRQRPMPLGDDVLPWYLGVALLSRGELNEAERVFEMAAETSAVELMRAFATDGRGIVAYRRGDPAVAGAFFRQALASFTRYRHLRGYGCEVEHLACVAGIGEHWERAGRLLGAAEMLYDRSNSIAFPPWQLDRDQMAAACQNALGEKAFASVFAAGRAMSVERAVQYALEPDAPPARSRRPARQGALTEREQEIAGLVAEGLSNRRIAAALTISEKTAESHLSHILSKLDLPSRASLAVWASQQGLLGTQSSGSR